MLNAILLMLLTGVVWSAVGVLFGRAPAEKDRLCTFFALNSVISTSFVYLTQCPLAAPPAEVLRLAGLILPSALLEVVAFLLLKLAMARGSQGIAWCIAQSAMVLAFLGSILFLKNPSSPWQWTGMALMLVSLIIFGRDKRSDSKGVKDATFFSLV
jgi:drug/metabolite transporter (DMT)-like permease